MLLSSISASTDADIESYPEEEEKVAHPTTSPWHHQNCYQADHLGLLQRSSIRTRRLL